MRFFQDTTFAMNLEKSEEFQQWFIANKSRIEADYPEGMSLVGMFVTVLGPGEGELHVIEQLDGYAALDRLAQRSRSPESRALQTEFASFVDFSVMPSTNLMKDVVDVTVQNVPAAEAPELAKV